MSNYIDRMKVEHKDLSLKIDALNGFIFGNELFKSLSDIEQSKMIKQVGFMESYREVLESRIWTAVK